MHLFFPSPGNWKHEIQVWAGLVPPEASLPGVHMPSPPHVLTRLSPVCVYALIPSSIKDPSHMGSDGIRAYPSDFLLPEPPL